MLLIPMATVAGGNEVKSKSSKGPRSEWVKGYFEQFKDLFLGPDAVERRRSLAIGSGEFLG